MDPLASSSTILLPSVVGEEHYRVAQEVIRILQRYQDLQDIIAILGIDELVRRGQATGGRARRIERFLSQNMIAAEQFTGQAGSNVPVKETIEAFDAVQGRVRSRSRAGFLHDRWPRRPGREGQVARRQAVWASVSDVCVQLVRE